MFKSAVLILLVASLLIWTGCYETVSLTRESYKHMNQNNEINVLVDSAGTIWKYHFSNGMYRIVNDTLVGTGTVITNSGEEALSSVAIPVSKIRIFEAKELNLPETLLLAGGFVGATALIVLLANPPGATQYSTSSSPTPR